MLLIKRRFSDKGYRIGIVCILLSLLFYCLSALVHTKAGDTFTLFIFNFTLTGFYFVYRLGIRKQTPVEARIHHVLLFLILFFISAWSLNTEITVFEKSTPWFTGLLLLVCANYMAFAYVQAFPLWAKHLVSFLNGVALVTFLYMSLYLLPLFAAGLVIFFLLGISLHVFVPLLFFIYTIALQNRMGRRNNQYWISFAGGIVTVLGIIIIYLLQWVSVSKQISQAWQAGKTNKTGLPAWAVVAQHLPSHPVAGTILKSGFVYSTPGVGMDNFFWRVPVRNLGEDRRHDPLVMIALFFSGTTEIDETARIKILETGFGMHQETEERLWSGDHLHTDAVNTEVKLWPRCNLAYTEKTLTVSNDNVRHAWGNQEEAIYTFFMPEGAVVTSLSLWVQGKEEKGILTTKTLADSAYKAIVGVEKRDPSVVHWQEGNTVSVRVFPVIAGEQRKFKLGITSPLERINGKLRYENIYFKGPAFDKAGETIQIDFEQPVNDFDLPAAFVSKTTQSYHSKRKYDPAWGLQINDPGLSGCSFSFEGNEYSLSPYHKKLSPADFTNIYLDINQSWTREEYDAITGQAKDKNVFVYDNGIVKVQDTVRDELWEKLHRRHFSLFPLYEVCSTEQSLLVTKYAPGRLRLADLDETEFMKKTRQFLSHSGPVNVFNLGDDLSFYLRSLKEFRVFRYESGDAGLLVHRLQKAQFPEDIENDNRVVIHCTEMVIEKIPRAKEVSGPDHVMRLFAYNHIMQRLGAGLLLDRPVEDSLVQEAQAAYVVSPVSSLVVLETRADYDRFGIKDTGSSLENASLHSKGAVPEPHEWVLIGLVIAVVIFLIRKRKTQYSAQ